MYDKKIDFDDVLIVPKRSNVSSRADVELINYFSWGIYSPWEYPSSSSTLIIPIIASNMYNIGTLGVAKILKRYNILTALVKGIKTIPDLFYHTFETFGINGLPLLSNHLMCLDVANGYLQKFIDRVKECRDKYPTTIIMAGNVVTPEGVENLAKAGANIIKVGLGSGSACATREKTGVGFPQLSAVIECSEAADQYLVSICSDGGHRTPGDIVKSFVAGADFVMLGRMLAGTNETGTTLYGNASKKAQGELEKYRAEEGKEIQVPLKGTLDDVIQDILGGLRSACTYVGARNLKELQQKTEFVRIT